MTDRSRINGGIPKESANGDVVSKVRIAGNVVFVEVRDVKSIKESNASLAEGVSGTPAGGGIVTAIDHDALAITGRYERARAVLDVEYFNDHAPNPCPFGLSPQRPFLSTWGSFPRFQGYI
jgi:hypothetical protein